MSETKRALLLTAKDTETKAIKCYLDEPERYVRTSQGNRVTVWSASEVEGLEVALYETGRGQSEALLRTGPIVEAFDPDVVVYIGCAGGEPTKTEIGDVYVATKIWNYERASVSEDRVKNKGEPVYPDRVLVDEARGVADFNTWRSRVAGGSPNEAKVLFGEIASGEKVVKSTQSETWQNIQSLSDDIEAVETEGHGFLTALVPLKCFGIMVRGISDNLDKKDAHGKQVDDDNQTRAVSHAAAFTMQLLEDIDVSALRAIRVGKTLAKDDEPEKELLSIRLEANREDVEPILARILKVSRAFDMKVKKVDEGSIICFLEMNRKSVVFSNALFEAGLLSELIGYRITGLVASSVRSHDRAFDAWIDEVKSGLFDGPASQNLRGDNASWKEHGNEISRQRSTKAEAPSRRGRKLKARYRIRDLAKLRMETGLSKSKLALRSGVSNRTLANAEKHSVTKTSAMKILRSLGEMLDDRDLRIEDYLVEE